MTCKAQEEFSIFAKMKIKLKVVNNRQGRILTKYMNYILETAYYLTDGDIEDNKKFMNYSDIMRGIVAQSNLYTEQTEMQEYQLVHEWLFMTPNLMFHSFNGFLAGLGCDDDLYNEELLTKTFNTIKGLSDIANKTKLKPNFKEYDYHRD